TSTASCSTRSTSTASSSASCTQRSRSSSRISPTWRRHGGRRPTPGMWELRGEPRHHLSSKVLCWVALDRAVKLSPALGTFAKAEEWTAERDRIREAILERGWSDVRRAYAQSFDADELDAAQLLMPLVGFLPATDERMRATIDAIDDDLVSALAQAGEVDRAEQLFDRLAGSANDL